MNTPWMLITGCSIFGFFIPETLAAFGKINRIPLVMNLLCATAAGLIAASFA